MNRYHKVNRDTGEIVFVGRVSSDLDKLQELDSVYAVYAGGANQMTQYYEGNVLTDRPIMNVEFDNDTLSGIVLGSKVRIRKGYEFETIFTADGSNVSLDFEEEGIYTYFVTNWPYQNIKGEIECK